MLNFSCLKLIMNVFGSTQLTYFDYKIRIVSMPDRSLKIMWKTKILVIMSWLKICTFCVVKKSYRIISFIRFRCRPTFSLKRHYHVARLLMNFKLMEIRNQNSKQKTSGYE